ncbi:cytochrome P450 [Nocardia iowensis]|uniref:Cytochrome P450 n=1 Tax=Nocardia iowensis TaxID=204891 RepID=A0ABX8RJA2_NOCIO|nr:cytochrome P450 [Nocardia iowensis]QXN88370.1 cytochrome P450 [Nocardia iowensis]
MSLPTLPFDQPDPFAPAPLLRRLQAERPIAQVRTAVGNPAWLVTRHAEVKRLFLDDRLGRSHPDPDNAPRVGAAPLLGPTQDYATEPTDHAKLRALFTPFFSARRMRAIRPRVTEHVDRALAAMAAATRPADLRQALSVPIPSAVLCELLGIPTGQRARFQAAVDTIMGFDGRQAADAGLAELISLTRELIGGKRADPRDDVLSSLCAPEHELSDDDIAHLAAFLLTAGLASTSSEIDVGVVLLLSRPGQWQVLRNNPDLVPSAVEEILRVAISAGGGDAPMLPRYARADIELGDVTIRAGELVLLDITAANIDPRAFTEPDHFDLTRAPNHHLAFGHGPWHCLGAPLARMQLQVVFAGLVTRFPTLRLAVPVSRIPVTASVLDRGIAELPVTW